MNRPNKRIGIKSTLLTVIFLFISCHSAKKTVNESEFPSKPEFDRGGLIRRQDGIENKKRWEYYNSLQHKQKQPFRNK